MNYVGDYPQESDSHIYVIQFNTPWERCKSKLVPSNDMVVTSLYSDVYNTLKGIFTS